MLIKVFNKELEYSRPISLLNILKQENIEPTKYICAKVNNRLRELTYEVSDNYSVIEFLDLNDRDSMMIYQASLRYLFVMAVNAVFPGVKVIFNYSISRAIFAKFEGSNFILNQDTLNLILKKLKEITESDLPIIRKNFSKEKAREIYISEGFDFKINMLKYRDKDVNAYQCEDYINYMYNYMVPSTKFINKYEINLYSPGVLIQYPRAELEGEIPSFENEMVFGKTLKESNKWGVITKSSYVDKLNHTIESNKYRELINLCETRHNNMLAELGSNIKNDIENIKLIAIAGPSSSGKTTFCNRLRIELMTKGITPLMISIDDYYKTRDEITNFEEDGTPDFEHVEALDLKLFNDHIYRLIQGEEITLPKFDFQSGKRVEGQTIKLEENQPILIEGIHALNDILTPSIPSNQKYKIYIAPQSQLHIDEHNPISMTDIRLIRRMVRDYKYRNTTAEKTLAMWPSVRRGEFKWIYPYQQLANYVFNSELTYELSVMKKYAIKGLEKISNNSEHYITANRLLKFLRYIKEIDEKWIPCNSILREFIGDSIFYEE